MKIEDVNWNEILDYNPDTGVLKWKIKPHFRKEIGDVADRINPRGYRSIYYKGFSFLSHRIVWYMVHGVIDRDLMIDHINGDKVYNRISNLRLVDGFMNQQNRRTAPKKSSSGLLGVSWCNTRKKWKSSITVRNKGIMLGRYDCKFEAHEVYLKAKRKLHGGNTL